MFDFGEADRRSEAFAGQVIAQMWFKLAKENVMGRGGLPEVRSETGELWKPAGLLRNPFGEGIPNLSVFPLSLLTVLHVD